MTTHRNTSQPLAGKRKPWQFMTRFVIKNAEGDPYLIRYRLIDTPYGGIFLHKILQPDSDPFVHDHPWSFVAFVLRGGYVEKRRDNHTHQLAWHVVQRVNIMRRDDAHYIHALHRVPTWTLVFHGFRRRTWGFWVPTEPAPNQTWVEFDNWSRVEG